VELLDGAVLPELPLELPLPLQAARTPAESTATALKASALVENQGKSGRTPGSSFLLVQDSSGFEPAGNVRMITFEGYTGRMCLLPDECSKIFIFIALADQALDQPVQLSRPLG